MRCIQKLHTVTPCYAFSKTLTVKKKIKPEMSNFMVRLWHQLGYCTRKHILKYGDMNSGIYRRLKWRDLGRQWHLWASATTSMKSSTQRPLEAAHCNTVQPSVRRSGKFWCGTGSHSEFTRNIWCEWTQLVVSQLHVRHVALQVEDFSTRPIFIFTEFRA